MRLVVNKRSGEQFDVYVGRPTRWGNPFSHRDGTLAEFRVPTREAAIREYREWLWEEIASGRLELEELAQLEGKRLACWCAPAPCHAEVLVEAAKWAKTQL